MIWEVIIPLAVALIAAIGAYFSAIRKLSGTIGTSTAEDLWTESRQMRRDLNTLVRQLTDQLTNAQKRIDELETENATQAAKIRLLQFDVDRLTKLSGGDQ